MPSEYIYISFYSCKALFGTSYITSECLIELQLSQIKLGVSCYIMTVQDTLHVL
jgi:hypothetical protein